MAYLGLIEGFYGSYYSDEMRKQIMSFMHKHDYSFYIYAPKNDGRLRKTWDKDLSADRYSYLHHMAEYGTKSSLQFGVGLSPLNISLDYDEHKKQYLQKSVHNICKDKKVEIFALLFDDVKLQCSEIGQIQNTIIKDVMHELPLHIKKFIVCPSYYTFDPILDRIFGTRPDNYFCDLCSAMDKSVEFFWTGNKVLSDDISVDDIQKANALFDRKVFIWDNYPVNDGKKISQYIYTKSFKGRYNLEAVTAGHAVNPMLEPKLSLISILTLPLIYKNTATDDIERQRESYIHKIFTDNSDTVLEFFDEVLECGLDNLNEHNVSSMLTLCSRYEHISEYKEIKDFLNHVYVFDPDYPDTE